MKEVVLTIGGIFGGLSVLFGAFGAHALKKKFTGDQMKSFETGIKYQMFHALLLIISGYMFAFIDSLQIVMGWSLIIGTILFSFSIYGLCLSSSYGRKIKLLGPLTPLGGVLLLVGWILFTINAAQVTVNL